MDSTFSLVEKVFTGIIHRGILKQMTQSIVRLPRSDAFMETLIGRVVNNPGFIAPVAESFSQRATNEVNEELKREPPLTMEIKTSPHCSPLAFAGSDSDEESKSQTLAS